MNQHYKKKLSANKKSISLGFLGLIIIAGAILIPGNLGTINNSNKILGGVKTHSFWSSSVWNTTDTAHDSDLIITGRVINVSDGKWATSGGKKPKNITATDVDGIYHTVTIAVNKTFKGPEKERITIRVNNGKVGKYYSQSSSAPKYTEGAQVLVFVQKWEGHYETFNQKYGKFQIEEGLSTESTEETLKGRINVSQTLEMVKERYPKEE